MLATTGLLGCTNSGSSSSVIGSITDGIKDILNPDPTLKSVEKQVSDIQSKLNQDSAYALTQEDIQFLQSQGLVASDSELKAWVK